MKKKVIIERVPSSKKKVVIQGLPKAQGGDLVEDNNNNTGMLTPKIADEPYVKSPKNYQGATDVSQSGYNRINTLLTQNPDLLSTYNSYDEFGNPVGNPIKTGDATSFYNKVEGQVPFKTGIYEIGTTNKPSVNKKLKGTKPNVNWDFSKSNFGLLPLSGGKYAQRGFSYLNQIPGQIQDAVSVFKTGKPTEKKQYPAYNPYVNAYWNYAEGGYLPMYEEAGITLPTMNSQSISSLNPDTLGQPNLQKLEDIGIDKTQLQNPYGELSEYMKDVDPLERKEVLSGLDPETRKNYRKYKALKTIQKVGAVAAPVASTVLAGYNFAKQGLSDVGSNIANRKAQQAENQLYTQSVFSDAMNVTPYEEQGYGFTGRNALAANGMQIKQIGGMGEPNVEVEGKEHIQLPNGFSQEIQGKKHSEGGIPINLPQGTKIFSEKLKVPVSFLKEAIALDPENQMLKSLKLPKTGKVSYADLAKKFETKKYVDLLNSKDADAIQMTTAQLMIQQNNAKLEELFGLQEQNKISGVHGPQVQQNAQQEQQEQEAQEAQMQGEEMEQPMMKYGGYHLPKAQDGLLSEKGYEAIDRFENTKGTAQGTSMNKGSGYSKVKEKEIRDYVDKTIGLDTWNKLPENAKVQAYSFMFNHGTDSSVWKGLAQAIDFDKYASGNVDMDEARQNISLKDAINTIKSGKISNKTYQRYVGDILPMQYQTIADYYDPSKSINPQEQYEKTGQYTSPEYFQQGQSAYQNTWKNRATDIDNYFNEPVSVQPANQPNQTQVFQSSSGDYGGIGIKPVSFKTPEGSITELGLNINNAIPDWRSRDLTKWDKAYGFDPGYIQSLANDPIVAKRYGALPGKDPVAALYQEYMYDYHLDRLDPKQNFSPEEREKSKQALRKMWEPTGSTRYGLKQGIKGKNIDFNKAGYEEYNKLRTSFIDGIGKYRYLEPNEQSAATSTTTPKTEETPPPAPNVPTPNQVINQTYEVPGLNLGIALPNVYERMPLNYYKTEPEYIDPRYLDIQPQLNRIGRGQRAIESTLGSRGSSDMANLLQAQANRSAAEQEAYGQKYNYDRAQDAAAQQFNAQAKMNVNQYNQGSWFQQLEDPIRRRESLIGTQQMMDDQAAIENARKMQAFYGNKDFIGDTFYPGQGWTTDYALSELPLLNKESYEKGLEEGKKAKKKDKYGGKIKIKPKLKNSYF